MVDQIRTVESGIMAIDFRLFLPSTSRMTNQLTYECNSITCFGEFGRTIYVGSVDNSKRVIERRIKLDTNVSVL